MNAGSQAVFLSYASQDAAAVTRIAEALRASGVEVWFDKNELTGGDAWDQKIRGQIKSCALFVPVISAATNARREGYFRREWKLAVDRTHDMDEALPFLLPAVIDATTDAGAFVPEKFREVQWTRLPGGETNAAFCARVKKLLAGETARSGSPETFVRQRAADETLTRSATARRVPVAAWVGAAVVALSVAIGAALWWNRGAAEKPKESTGPVSTAAVSATGLIAKARALLHTPSRARFELEEADRLCKQAGMLDERSAELWAVWSMVDSWSVYYNFDNSIQRREAARTKAEKAVGVGPTGFEARLAQVAYLALANQRSDAVSAFAGKADQTLRELLKERPRDPEALLVFALLQRNLGVKDAARQAFRDLAAIPGFAGMAFTELGWAEFQFGENIAANAAADRAMAAERYWNSLILKTEMALFWLGDLALAKATFEQMPTSALQEDSGIYYALFLAQVGRDSAATLALVASVPREWLQSNFFEGPIGYFAGSAHAANGGTDAARQSWERALRQVETRLNETPQSPELLIWKVRLQALLGDQPTAAKTFQLFKQITNRRSLRGERGYERAADYWMMGERDAAIAFLEEGLRRFEITWATLQIAPQLEPLRGDPRFQERLKGSGR